MTEIIEYFEALAERIGLIFQRLSEFGGSDLVKTLNLNVAANLEIIDDKNCPHISMIVGKDMQRVVAEKNPALNYIIISKKDMWVRVFSGEESLISNVVSGEAKVSNLRANWLNCMMFSILISTLLSLKIIKFK